jgi:transcriptional regulator with XRE-family HTH domain
MIQKIRQDRIIGDNLRDLRIKNGFSQEKLCAELQRRGCDIARSAYAKYEAGELNVKVSVILALKKIYNCQFDDFFAGLEIEQND